MNYSHIESFRIGFATPISFAHSFMMLGLLACSSSNLSADEPQQAQEGSVEIVLKLLPSAPEKPGADAPASTESPQASAEKKAESDAEGTKPVSQGQTPGDSQSQETVKLTLRPSKKPLRQLEISIEPVKAEKEKAAVIEILSPLESSPSPDVPGLAVQPNPTEECPGGQPDSNEVAGDLPVLPGDVPLEQEEHPFEVPDAVSTAPEPRFLPASIKTSEPIPGLAGNQDLQSKIDEILQYFREHPENVVRRGPWALMHAILPYGVEAEVFAGNKRVNAIGWLCHNGVSARQRMFQPTQSGFRPNLGPGVQGHEGQFLAILAQSRVQADYPLKVGKRKYTIQDLVRYEMATCREKSELTFKLIAFSHYLKPDQTWRDNRGKTWSIEKLVAEELAQPITGAACGGTHRLMGLSCAVIRRQESGLPISGHFQRAQIFLDDFVAYTLTMQNPDGSFSTEWFERRANESNTERKIQTTGHILEWLVYTLPDQHLRKPEIENAVKFLADTLSQELDRDWPIGPRGHSLRALMLYQQRVFPKTITEPIDGGRLALEPSNGVTNR